MLRSLAQFAGEEEWDLQLDVDLKAGFFLCRAFGQALVAGGRGGRIVNFSSPGFIRGTRLGAHAYVAAKGGIVSMSRDFARWYGPHGITVNSLLPGPIDTPMQHTDQHRGGRGGRSSRLPAGAAGPTVRGRVGGRLPGLGSCELHKRRRDQRHRRRPHVLI